MAAGAPPSPAVPAAPAATPAAPVPDGAPPAPEAARPAAMQRPGLGARVRAWLRLAYTDADAAERRTLLEIIVTMVIVSMVATVLERDPGLDEQYHYVFLALEAVVLVCFVADFLLNVAYSAARWRYALTPWGIID